MSSDTASAAWRISASATRTSRKPTTSMKGSRSAASTGGTIAFRIAISAATTKADPTPPRATPGTSQAATQTAPAPVAHATIDGTSRNRGGAGRQRSCSPYAEAVTRSA